MAAIPRLRMATTTVAFGAVGIIGFQYLGDAQAGIYRGIMHYLHKLDPEDAHYYSIQAAKYGLVPRARTVDSPCLSVSIFGKLLSNPIGLAAGYDKHAEAIDSMLGLGFGYVEVGSIPPNPQLGNPKPRFFRLEKDAAVINRYGFNSQGHGAALVRLQKRLDSYVKTFGTPSSYSLKQGTMLGINLGKNKYSPESSHQDYLDGIETLGPYADIIVINISSPNTPGLRSLQRREPIKELLTLAKQKRDKFCPRPLVVKIAPDCDDIQLSDIASVVQEVGIDGIIIGNTTISRNGLKSDPELVNQVGGLSGKPLKPLALAAVSKFYNLTKGKVPIIGCGGISNAQDCLDFCEAGATIVQIYTEFGYKGPSLIPDIKQELAELLEKRGKTWMETIGSKQ